MKFIFPLSRRLLIGFASLLLVFAVSSSLALMGLGEYSSAMHVLRGQESGARAALRYADAIRSEYAPRDADGNLIEEPGPRPGEERLASLGRLVQAHAVDLADRDLVSEIEKVRATLRDIEDPRSADGRLETSRSIRTIHTMSRRLSRSFEDSIDSLDERAARHEEVTYHRFLGLLVAQMTLTIAVGLYLGRTISRPMALLEEGAQRLASGDLSTFIDLDTGDEFGRLAQQFNRMTQSLREHRERLLQSERLAAIGRFAAGVAHEINNPLGVILGYVRVLRKESSGRAAEDLEIVEDEATRCQEIVEGLLDLARPVQGDSQPTDLRSILLETIAWLRETSLDFGSDVQVSGQGLVIGNRRKLKQVFINLIKNAAESSGRQGNVRIKIVSVGDHKVTLTVEDDGPGLTGEDATRLFEPFYTTKPGGTGLGLAVSRAIVVAHGGSLNAESPSTGGARFTIQLPSWAGDLL